MKNKIKEYKLNKISIEELIHFFDKNNFTSKEIKENGIIYTPKYIVNYMIEKIKPKIEETIFEPAVGHGIFIFGILEYIENKYNLTSNELKEYFLTKIYMQDIEKQTIEEIKEIIQIFFKKKGVILKKEEIINIEIGDTLNKKIDIKYDIIIGNPPYVNIRNINKNSLNKLRLQYKSCEKGNIDLYYAFIEYAYKYSNRFIFITPNSWIYSISGENLRKKIKKNIIEIIDFKQKQIFKTADTYTSILYVNKKEEKKEIIYKEDIKKDEIKFLKDKLEDKRWSFNKKEKGIEIDWIKFHTPIATLRDKIFIEHNLNKNNKDVITFYKISKIKKKEDFFKQEKSIIFPYKLNKINNKFQIKKEKELDRKTLEYLKKEKEELKKRDKGKTDKYEAWYAYGRKQGINKYNEKTELIVIPGIISNEYNFFSINIQELKKPFLFSSGFLLEIEQKDKQKVLKYLNSNDFKNYIKNEGKVWKGKTNETSYYSLSITQLKKVLKTKEKKE